MAAFAEGNLVKTVTDAVTVWVVTAIIQDSPTVGQSVYTIRNFNGVTVTDTQVKEFEIVLSV